MAKKKKKITPLGQQVMFLPESSWRPPKVDDLPSWDHCKRVSIDCETRDDHLLSMGPGVRRGGFVCGYSFAFDDGPSFYVPVAHDDGDNVEDPAQAWRFLRDQAKAFKGEIVGANINYDLDYLAEQDVLFGEDVMVRDVQVAEVLLDDLANSYSLDAVLGRYGMPLKDETLLKQAAEAYGVDPKGGLWRMKARYVGAYGEVDTERPLELLRRQEKALAEQGLMDIYNLESRVTPVLVRMRRRGIRVDMDHVAQVESWSLREEAKALEQVFQETKIRIGVGDTMKSHVVAQALEATGMILNRTSTGLPEITKLMLEQASDGNPVAGAVLHARKMSKLRKTFANQVRKFQTNDRLHCVYNQMARQAEDDNDVIGARFGRMSCMKPNLTQQPARDDFANYWRELYKPEEGCLLSEPDYSSQEPRMQAHYSILSTQPGWRTIQRAYEENPNLDPHAMTAEWTGLERTFAKTIYLGLCVGRGTLVLTDGGEKPIEEVSDEDRVWDGACFVEHDGVMHTGVKQCLRIANTWMTPQHEVLTPVGWFQAQDLSMNNLPSEWYTAYSPSSASSWVSGGESSPSSVVAPVVEELLRSETIWSQAKQHAVLSAVKARLLWRIHDTVMCQNPIVLGFLAALVRSLAAVLHNRHIDTESAELPSTRLGSLIDDCFLTTWSRYQDGIIPLLRLTEETTTRVTNPEIFASLLSKRTYAIEAFDIVNAGPHKRFLANGLIVSNCYGMGSGKLARSLGLPTKEIYSKRLGRDIEIAGEEAQAIMNKFDQKAPHVRALARAAEKVARSRGYIITVGGRRCRFAMGPQGRMMTHKALNRLIQGSCADQTKLAMVEADRAGFFLQLQIHDSIIASVESEAEGKRLTELMRDVMPLEVASKVDLKIGPHWGAMRKA